MINKRLKRVLLSGLVSISMITGSLSGAYTDANGDSGETLVGSYEGPNNPGELGSGGVWSSLPDITGIARPTVLPGIGTGPAIPEPSTTVLLLGAITAGYAVFRLRNHRS